MHSYYDTSSLFCHDCAPLSPAQSRPSASHQRPAPVCGVAVFSVEPLHSATVGVLPEMDPHMKVAPLSVTPFVEEFI